MEFWVIDMNTKILDGIDFILETFKDLGKLIPDQLKKGQRLDPDKEDYFKQVDGRVVIFIKR